MTTQNWTQNIDRKPSNPNNLGIIQSWSHNNSETTVEIIKAKENPRRNSNYFIETEKGDDIDNAETIEEAEEKATQWMKNYEEKKGGQE